MNARRRLFVQEYLVDLNATQAAIRAGYSVKTADRAGYELLNFPEIRAAVDEAIKARAERIGLTADDVLRELKTIGMSDVSHYQVGSTAQPLSLISDAPSGAMRAVASVKRRVRRVQKEEGPAEEIEDVEYRLWDKNQALRMAGEHLGLWKGQPENPNTGPTFVAVPVLAKDLREWNEVFGPKKPKEEK